MKFQSILLIDDAIDDQEIFGDAILSLSDRLIFKAMGNAMTALDKLRIRDIKPDLIFPDLNMPVMPGQEFLRAIKKIDHLSSVPVIISSTSSNADTKTNAKDLGATAFITKPNRFDKLVEILKPLIVKSN